MSLRIPEILLIEHDQDDLVLIQAAFKRVGVRNYLRIARHIQEAKSYLGGVGIYANRTNYPLPGIIILDADFPTRDGPALVQWIRAQPELEPLPLVVIGTAQTDREIQHIYDFGANAYLEKICNLQELAGLIKNLDFVAPLIETTSP